MYGIYDIYQKLMKPFIIYHNVGNISGFAEKGYYLEQMEKDLLHYKTVRICNVNPTTNLQDYYIMYL